MIGFQLVGVTNDDLIKRLKDRKIPLDKSIYEDYLDYNQKSEAIYDVCIMHIAFILGAVSSLNSYL